MINLFTEENIIEPLVNFYKDFNYVNYILNHDFETSYKLFLKMKEREIKEIEKKHENRAYQLYLKSNIQGITFKDFYNDMKRSIESDNMTDSHKEKEENRLWEKYRNVNIDEIRKKAVK